MSRFLAYLICRVFELLLAMATVQLALGIGRMVWSAPTPVVP